MAVVAASMMSLLDGGEVPANYTARNLVGAPSKMSAETGWLPPKYSSNILAWGMDNEECGYAFDMASTDMTGTHFRIWAANGEPWLLVANPPPSGNAGVFVLAIDSSANWGYYFVDGGNTYLGSMKDYVVDLDRTPDGNNGSDPNLANCVALGVVFDHTLGTSKAALNSFIDYLRTGNDGLKITTTVSTVATADTIAAAVSSSGHGVWDLDKGVHYLSGPVQFGDSTTGDFQLSDTNQVVIFEDRPVSTSYYYIKLLGSGSSTTEWIMGTKSGSRGIQGWTLTCTDSALGPDVDVSDPDIDKLQWYGSTWTGFGAFTLPPTATNREVIDGTWIDCGPVDADTCSLTFCNFIDAPGSALVIDSTSFNASYCSFINCDVGVQVDTVGSYDFDGMVFSGSVTADIENTTNAVEEGTYDESNQSVGQTLRSGSVTACGQSFEPVPGGDLSSATFFIAKMGSPTGTLVAKLYTHTGTYGTSSTPDTLVVTSEALDVATDVTFSFGLKQFEFHEAQPTLSATYYVIVVEFVSTYSDGTNNVIIGSDSSSPTHGGNGCWYTSSWTATVNDFCFYVHSGGIVSIEADASTGSNPSSSTNTGTPPGITVINTAVTLTISGLIAGSEVRIFRTSGDVELAGVETSGTSFAYQYNYTGDVNVYVIVLNTYYVFRKFNAVLTDTNVSIPATQRPDRDYYNPS